MIYLQPNTSKNTQNKKHKKSPTTFKAQFQHQNWIFFCDYQVQIVLSLWFINGTQLKQFWFVKVPYFSEFANTTILLCWCFWSGFFRFKKLPIDKLLILWKQKIKFWHLTKYWLNKRTSCFSWILCLHTNTIV